MTAEQRLKWALPGSGRVAKPWGAGARAACWPWGQPPALARCQLWVSEGQVVQLLLQQAQRVEKKMLLDSQLKLLQVHSSSKHKCSLKEALCDAVVSGHCTGIKAVAEMIKWESFHQMLPYSPDKELYGIKHVAKAHKAVAVDTSLKAAELLVYQNVALRRVYLQKVPKVIQKMRLFSTFHIGTEEWQPSFSARCQTFLIRKMNLRQRKRIKPFSGTKEQLKTILKKKLFFMVCRNMHLKS